MYEQNILDQQAFAREATIASAVANPYLESGKVLIAETGLFYDVVTTNSTGAIALTNGKFLKHIENIKVNGNVLKGEITVTASQVPQDANNRFITDTERTNWNNKSNKTVQMIAGNGLAGGGTLEANRTFNVVSANDGIVVNADDIQLNPVNALNSTSTTRPLTAAQGKALEDKKLNLSGGTMSGKLIANEGIDITAEKEISFARNTDYFKLGFKNTADSDTDSYGYITMGDNGNEYFKFRSVSGSTTTDVLSIKTSGITASKFIGSLEGNANTATTLQTARTIGGVSFNGSANINLPGVNTQGNQNTTGNANTATALQTARTIGGVSFNGTANINLPGVNTTGNQNTTGSAATLTTARTLTVGNTGKSFNGSGNVSWSLNEIGASLGQSISATTPATAGWYRIASSASGVSRNGGIFTIHTTVSSHHSTTVLTAGINYSSGVTLNQLSHSVYGSAITKARMVYHTTYSGNYAYLEVYLNVALASSINVYVSNPIGWSLVAPNTAGSIPTGYTNYEIALATNKIVSDLNGNSSSSTKLQTARTINGTNFDGAANITTANWGTARTLTIGSTGKSVNGSANVSWSLAELGLGNVNNTADSAKNVLSATKLTTARSINIGGSSKNFDGTANLNWNYNDIGSFASIGSDFSATDASYGWVNGTVTNGKNITSFTGNILQFGQYGTTGSGNHRTQLLVSQTGGLHYRTLHGAQQTSIDFKRVYDTSYKPLADAATKLQTARTIGGVSFDGTANINLPGVNTAGNQSTSGNAATATKLQTTRAINGTNFDGTAAITTAHWGTARTLTIGNTGKSVNGSGNVSWSLSEIGATQFIDISNNIQLTSYRRSVVGLIKLSATNSSTSEAFVGKFMAYRNNSLAGNVDVNIYISDPHSENMKVGWGGNGSGLYAVRPCTFIKGGVTYGGFEFYINNAEYQRCYLNGKLINSNGNKPYVAVDYVTTQGEILDSEINSSIDFDKYVNRTLSFAFSSDNIYAGNDKKIYHQGFKPTATDVGLSNVPNTVHTTAATANTVAVRDSSGDINVRLLRPNYADQSTISGAMAFRINNGSDNYIRFCNNVTNIRNWLGAAASSHTHSISQITGGTHSTITMTSNNTSGTYDTRSIELREVNNVTTGQSSDAYAPAIGWHWGGRYGKKLFMNASGRLVFDGDFSANKVYNAVWNDYAEYFPKLETTITEAGDIIALSLNDDDELYELATEDHVMIVGAHSDQYGHIIGGENPENGESFEEYNNKKFIPVGLVGRLPIKFIGEAKKGMKVVPSHIPGVGRKFDSTKDDYDKVIGYIVENNNDEGIRRVKIKIGK